MPRAKSEVGPFVVITLTRAWALAVLRLIDEERQRATADPKFATELSVLSKYVNERIERANPHETP